jgi:hypothetical protein
MSVEGKATNDVLQGRVVTIPQTDETLSKAGYSADAKTTGEKIKALEDKYKDVTTPDASKVDYDNTTSKLSAENVQSAIDEIVAKAIQDIAGVLKLTGGELSGSLKIKHHDNGWSTLDKNHSATADYGTYIADTSKNGKSAKVSVCAELNTLTFTNIASEVHDIFHEGNKPFGEYVGNGSATERVIDTKGIGRLCLIYCSDYLVLATPKGAFKVTLSDGTLGWILATNLYFVNGKLNIATGGEAVNKADETYYYQVI